MRRLEAIVMAAVLLAPSAAFAGWRDEASSFDQSRLSRLDESRAKGLSESAGSGSGDASAIHETLDPQSRPASAAELVGGWRCRTIKLGGMTPYVVYSWFRCRIEYRGGGLVFEKVSGSQHTNGTLYAEDGRFVYLGASTVKGEKAHTYSGNGASVGAEATPDDQIGVLSLIGERHARLELPYPVQESTFDVIELRR
jgi:hypothetical protein